MSYVNARLHEVDAWDGVRGTVILTAKFGEALRAAGVPIGRSWRRLHLNAGEATVAPPSLAVFDPKRLSLMPTRPFPFVSSAAAAAEVALWAFRRFGLEILDAVYRLSESQEAYVNHMIELWKEETDAQHRDP